jgi:hypothetical protein
VTRRALVHGGWPKTATTTLQQQLRVAWPNLAGRPWNRPGGEASKLVLGDVVRGRADGKAIDGLFESSWHDRSLPVVLSHEGLVGMRKWQFGRDNVDSLAVAGHLAATSWPVHVVLTIRDPVELVRSNYRYAVRGGYQHSYRDYLEEEAIVLASGRGPFSIRNVVESWEGSFGREAVTIAWMDTMLEHPASFWKELAEVTGTAELERIADVPLEHLNPTLLGPLRWELAVNRLLAPKHGRRRSPYTARLRRAYNRHVARHLTSRPPEILDGGALELSVTEPMQNDVAWLRERYHF